MTPLFYSDDSYTIILAGVESEFLRFLCGIDDSIPVFCDFPFFISGNFAEREKPIDAAHTMPL